MSHCGFGRGSDPCAERGGSQSGPTRALGSSWPPQNPSARADGSAEGASQLHGSGFFSSY